MPLSLHVGPLARLSPEDKLRQIEELFHKLEDYINAQVTIYVKFSEDQKQPEFKKFDLLLDLVETPDFLTIFQWNGVELIPLAATDVSPISFDDITGDLDIIDRGVGSGTDASFFLKSDGAEHWMLSALDLILYGTGSGADASLFLKSDGAGGWVLAPPTTTDASNGLISGGGVFWNGNLDFTVSAANYQIAGTIYNSPQTDITLTAADPTDDRIDIIGVDDTGSVIIITGTPAPVPAAPDVDPTSQLQLTFVYIAAAATAPVITNENIYLENTEWTTTTNSIAHFTLASVSNPFAGTKDIEATAAANGNNVFLTKPSGALDLTEWTTLTFQIRSKATWPAAKGLTISWALVGASVGVPVIVKSGTFGFDSTNTTTYQQVTIPIASFSAGSSAVNRLRINVTGGGAAIGFYLDNIVLQGGLPSGGSGLIDLIARGIGSGSDPTLYMKSTGTGTWMLAPIPQTTIPFTASATLTAYAPVTVQGALGDSANVAHYGKVIGITTAAVTSGFVGEALIEGEIENLSWAWSPGSKIFLNGTTLSTTPVSTGFSQMIAIAKTATKIVIQPKHAVLL